MAKSRQSNHNSKLTRFLQKQPVRKSDPSTTTFADDSVGGTPVIIEPRPRTRSERPLSSASDIPTSLYSSPSSTRIGDFPARLSGWFQHTFSTSSTDLSLPSLLAQPLHSSPKPKGAAALLNVAKHGKGHLDKAVRYLLDSDTTPDKCTDPIWLLGLQHPGYEQPPPFPLSRRSSIGSKRVSPASLRSYPSPSTIPDPALSQSQPPSSRHPANSWPPLFYADFTTRIWLTYRSQFSPIRDSSLAALDADSDSPAATPPPGSSPIAKRWHWSTEKGWSTDTGWGCMLRTGQSLLANALLHLQLGRDWRRPPYPLPTADYATYVQILTWFFDTPSPRAPFSVHRMALAGKEQGTDVGQWFGPSTAAGAIRTLVHAFPAAQLGVAVAADGTLFETDVFAQSHVGPGPHARAWGDRAVLVLVGVRLGLDGVNPVYFGAIKALYTFPQSVGIAGGRPSSSYYFVGAQADSLFYLDPHHARPAVPLQPLHAPSFAPSLASSSSSSSHGHGSDMDDRELLGSVSGVGSPGALDPAQAHFATAYGAADLRTFHCDRVRKMPLSGLDPSMLLGFLCRDAADWADLRRRLDELARAHKPLFSVQDEPPAWPGDDDSIGLESMSEPDDGEPDTPPSPGSGEDADGFEGGGDIEDDWVDSAEDAPAVRARAPPPQHFPFPRSEDAPEERRYGRMHTARARDGGRTHSGGVRGVLPDAL